MDAFIHLPCTGLKTFHLHLRRMYCHNWPSILTSVWLMQIKTGPNILAENWVLSMVKRKKTYMNILKCMEVESLSFRAQLACCRTILFHLAAGLWVLGGNFWFGCWRDQKVAQQVFIFYLLIQEYQACGRASIRSTLRLISSWQGYTEYIGNG